MNRFAFCVIGILLYPSLSLGAARGIFTLLNDQALLIVQAVDMNTGAIDQDPYELYDQLNVPENTIAGGDKGKILESTDKSLLLTCVERVGTGLRQCQFMVNGSQFTKIDRWSKRASYFRVGEESGRWAAKFPLDKNGQFKFVTADGKLEFTISERSIELTYAE